MKTPRRLGTKVLIKPWGTPLTNPWLENPAGQMVGEVWFTPPPAVPILVKFLFTTGRLSIQVHPNDEYARGHHSSNGKTEMWHVLRSESDSTVGLGLRAGVTREQLVAAAGTAELEGLLDWMPARVGDTFFTEAETIHAVGKELVICEVQQISDVTYRLWDYGSDRELHLADGMRVSRLTTGSGRREPVALGGGRELLAECAYFRTERVTVEGTGVVPGQAQSMICVALAGSGELEGVAFGPGVAWELPGGQGDWNVVGERVVLLTTMVP